MCPELASVRFPAAPTGSGNAPECAGTGNDKSAGPSAIPQQSLAQCAEVTNRKSIQVTVRKTPHTVSESRTETECLSEKAGEGGSQCHKSSGRGHLEGRGFSRRHTMIGVSILL